MSEAILLRAVTRAYGGGLALDDVSLSLPAGAVTALLGASGSGKSTMLRLIAGLEPVDSGAIAIGGETVSAPGLTLAPERRRIGLVFQDYALFPHLSARDNVAFGLDRLAREERRAVALDWLARVGLAHRALAFPHELSGGEQQRVALARALAPKPRAVLLDEPFSGLDPALRAELREATLEALAASGATALFVTHDADEALYVADQLAILRAGRLVQAGAPRDIYDHPASPEAAAALGPINLIDARVANGAAATPFGTVAAPLFQDGAQVVVAVRAEALRIIEPQAGAPMARARAIRPQGALDLVALEAKEIVWRALAPRGAAPAIGASAGVRLDPAGAFVFSAKS